jgi:catalase
MGFVSVAEPAAEHKVRAKPEKFADHYSQASLFYRSQTPVEQQHIAAALRFELSRCTVPAIRERVVSVLANVDEALAAQVADDLGMPMPEAQPLASGKRVESEVPESPALSLMARPGDGRPLARRIALLVPAGVGADDVQALRLVQARLAELQAMPRIVGPKLGALQGEGAEPIEIESTVEAMPAVLWDAAVVAGAPFRQGPLRDARVIEFLRDQYRHGKPLLVLGDASALLAAAGIPATLPDGRPDPGLVVADAAKSVDGALDAFVAALGRHRVFERETDPPRV